MELPESKDYMDVVALASLLDPVHTKKATSGTKPEKTRGRNVIRVDTAPPNPIIMLEAELWYGQCLTPVQQNHLLKPKRGQPEGGIMPLSTSEVHLLDWSGKTSALSGTFLPSPLPQGKCCATSIYNQLLLCLQTRVLYYARA